MLKITTDGRKLALDQRLLNDMLPDTENNKVSACAERCFTIWEETKGQKAAQLVFCDSSTPKKDGTFNVYDALKEKLMKKGIPEEEIAFIHDANTDVQKARLFSKVRSGQVRFLLGSTSKMGAGTNVQDRLIALHHLDVPWRPADIEQQEGRILRQGNKNKKVKIFRYITENTFDAYSWQLIENKQKFIGQIMTSKSPVRSCQDVDEAALSYAEVKALATGNPKIKEKMDLDVQVTKLKMLKANYESNLFRLQDAIAVEYPEKIAKYEELTTAYDTDIKHIDTVLNTPFLMEIHGVTYNDEKAAGEMLVQACTQMKKAHADAENIGSFWGFQMKISYSLFDNKDYKNLANNYQSASYDREMQEKYKWIEYHKWKFKLRTYTALSSMVKCPVLMTRIEFGLLGAYNKYKKSPFETYYVGGDGMSGYSTTYATETIGLRGYDNGSLTPSGYTGYAYDRFTLELRYPLMLQGSTNIYALTFIEGGNAWSSVKDFNPFDMKRSAGVGVRIFLPMVGLLGIDWAYGFDDVFGSKQYGGSQFHFILGQEF